MSENNGVATPNSEQISEARKRSLANLRPWKPGQSGNKNGRPRRSLLDRQIDKLLRSRCAEDKEHRKFAELIAWSLAKTAIKGGVAGVAAARLLAERSGGKVMPWDEVEPITEINVRIFENQPFEVEEFQKTIEGK